MQDSGAQKGQVDNVKTGDGTKDTTKAEPWVGKPGPVTSTVPSGIDRSTHFTETIPRSGGTVSSPTGLASSLGRWPVSKSSRDSGGGKFKNPE